ncbi:MAG TPA: pyruvate kinase [Thermoleophilia bacterium]|nr:pyruvate kinase [Thermoleophilia bacterium]
MTDPQRRTKIVATLGPASRDEPVLARLLESGMDVARINLSHGTTDEHAATIALLRRVAAERGVSLAILIDLPGPKLRTGDLPRPLTVRAGEVVTLGPSAAAQLPVNFPEMLPHLTEGELILVDDGAVALRVAAVSPTVVTLEALNDGAIGSRKGVNLPDTQLPIAAFTGTDSDLLAWGLQQDIDYVALSFVRDAADILDLKRRIAAAGGDQLVVAKIERKEALGAYREIVAAADAVMVARGDLGVEVDAATVPVWQKRIIHAAVTAGRPVIIATQMLQSMIASPRATRAEASDVANAIYDAASAVMLSGETAIGGYPVRAVETMREIALVVEADIEREGRAPRPWTEGRTGVSDAISHGACEVAERIGAAAIVTATFSGATARAVARSLPDQPIVAISPNQRVVNQLALCWGVHALLGGHRASFEEIVREANDLVLAGGFGLPGDSVVITAGLQTHQSGKTNLIKAHILA